MTEVYVCSYERYVIGYKLAINTDSIKSQESQGSALSAKLELTFRMHSAASSLRCMATNGKTLACGSSDEAVYLYDIVNRKELGPVQFHTATVNCIDFYKQKIMISGSEDGCICLWDCYGTNFSLVKQFRIKHAITSTSIEPASGKVALTTDSGGYLKVWDLFSCVLAYSLPLKYRPHTVFWCPELVNKVTDRFALLSDNFLDVRSLANGDSMASFKIDNCGNLTCARFLSPEVLVVATLDGHLIIACLDSDKTIELRNAHNSRIKGLSVQKMSSDSNTYLVFSGSSDGYIKVWTVDMSLKSFDLNFVTLVNTKCRITSLESASVRN